MAEPNVAATITGGQVQGVAGAGTVFIENFTIYNSATSESVPQGDAAAALPPCPYPGLAYFGPDDAKLFFGRDAAIDRLAKAADRQTLVALVGASGSGKSSVVLAGLAPRLHALGGWRFSHFRIGTELDRNPFMALARALVPLYVVSDSDTERLKNTKVLAASLQAGDLSLPEVLTECRNRNAGKSILLIADQFEEAFTLVSDEALRNRFMDVLIPGFAEPPAASGRICLMLTLRADFYGEVLRYRPFADALQDNIENLGPMSRVELREAIDRPAQSEDVSFESGLVDVLLDDVDRRPGGLPLLQFALREMWARQEARTITHKSYSAIGGVEGALAQRAETVFAALTDNESNIEVRRSFERLFTRLVTLGQGQEDTRRVVERHELGGATWTLAQRLAGEDNRLVVTNAPDLGNETAEVIHEALIRHWPRLVGWVNRDRALQSWLRQIRTSVELWSANSSDEGLLLRGGMLAQATDWLARRREDLSPAELAFVEASIALRKRAEEEKEAAKLEEIRREHELADAAKKLAGVQKQRARLAYLGVVVAALLAGLAGYQALVARENEQRADAAALQANTQAAAAEASRKSALARSLAASARSLADQGGTKLQAAALLAAESLKREQSPQANEAARYVLSQMLRPTHVFYHPGQIVGIALSPDGAYLAVRLRAVGAAGARVHIVIWDFAQKTQLARRSFGDYAGGRMEFSRDARRLSVPTGGSSIALWEWNGSNAPLILQGVGWGDDISFSADGSRVMTNRGVVYSTSDGSKQPIMSHPASSPDKPAVVTKAIFHPVNPSIAILGYPNGEVAFFDVTRATLLSSLAGAIPHPPNTWNMIDDIVFSPRGDKLAVVARNGIRLWSIAIDQQAGSVSPGRSISEYPDQDRAEVIFDPSGKLLASEKNGVVSVWDAESGRLHASAQLGMHNYSRIRFALDGSYIVGARSPGGVMVWDWRRRAVVAHAMHDADVTGIAAFGKRLVTASPDGTAAIWNLEHEAGAAATFREQVGLLQPIPNSDRVAVESGRDLFVLPPESRVPVEDGRWHRFSFDREARMMAVTSEARIAVLDLPQMSEIFKGAVPRSLSESSVEAGARIERSIQRSDRQLFGAESEVLETVPFADLTTGETSEPINAIQHTMVSRRVRMDGEPNALGYTGVTIDVALSPGGERVAVSAQDWIWVFDVRSGKLLGRRSLGYERALRPNNMRGTLVESAVVRSLWFNESGSSVFAGTRKGVIWRWDIDNDVLRGVGRADQILMSSSRIVLALGKKTSVYDSDLKYERALSNRGNAWALGRSGRYVAFTDRRDRAHTGRVDGFNPGEFELTVVDAVSGVERTFHHGAELRSPVFSDDEKLVAAAGSDHTVRIWDIASGREIGRIEGRGEARISFVGNGTLAAAFPSDPNRIEFVPLGADGLIDELCARSLRGLTDAEWRDYLGGEPKAPTCAMLNSPVERSRAR